MPPYPSHISCTLSLDIHLSKNAIIILFDDTFNGTAKETHRNDGILELAVAHSEHEGFGNVRE
jgi:hypothetical protein